MSTVLNTQRKKIKVKLSKTGGTVWLWDEVLAGDFRGIMGKADPTKVTAETGFDVLVKLIAWWDFVDEKGEAIPVSEETLDKLPMADVMQISNHVTRITQGLTDEVKKNTNNSST